MAYSLVPNCQRTVGKSFWLGALASCLIPKALGLCRGFSARTLAKYRRPGPGQVPQTVSTHRPWSGATRRASKALNHCLRPSQSVAMGSRPRLRPTTPPA
eukprot:351548-Chlamydomonas_euryale.AAC.2